MRTNIVLDDDLVEKAFKFSKAKTKKELIHQALREFIESHHRRSLLGLEGKIEFSEGYDYKKSRKRRG